MQSCTFIPLAYYPEAPSTSEKLQALSFLGSFAALFPCGHCGSEFKEIMEEVFYFFISYLLHLIYFSYL